MSDAPADALMSVVAVPFVAGLPQWRILLVFLTYALASYPFVLTLVLTWANPLMIQRTGLVEMTRVTLSLGTKKPGGGVLMI